MIRKSLNSLAGKLILAVGCLMAVGGIVFGYIFIHYQETVMMRNLISNSTATADLVKRGISRSMLAGDSGAAERTVETIASSAGIKGISIFDKKGKIRYSSKKTDQGRSVAMDYPTCQICHRGSEKPLRVIPEGKNWRIISDGSGTKTLTMVIPMLNEPSCSQTSCHYHPEGQKILGILETNFSTAAVDDTIAQSRIGTLLFGGLFIIIISFTLCLILYKFVSKPVSLLDEGMRKIAKGDLDHVIDIPTNDEMGLLAQTFNSMAGDIKKYRESMENWTKALEEEVKKKKAEIMRAHDDLISAEKLASLGRMAAGVAHELNSPLTGIVTFAHLMQKRMPPESKQDLEDLEVIIEQTTRCSKIIKSLLGFSRRASAEKTMTDFNALIRSTVSMVKNQAKFYNIKFTLNLENTIPPILADANQIQQVFLNLLINAADAMNEKGEVTATTRLTDDGPNGKKQIEIEFSDTGPGIPPEHVGRIFEPFFTTKPVGKGTGLGLSVSYGIIKKHGGDIFVRSKPGKGASFFVRLPLDLSPEQR